LKFSLGNPDSDYVTIKKSLKLNRFLAGLWSRKSRHPTPTPGNFDYPTPTPTPAQLRPSAVLVN